MFVPFKRDDDKEFAVLWVRAVGPKSLTGELLDIFRKGMVGMESKIREVIARDFEAVRTC